MYQQPKRNRPRISTTISGDTQAIIANVAKDLALSTPGATVDFIVRDWVKQKRAAIRAAAPLDQLEQLVNGAYDEPLAAN